jgi:hypothetical protein
VKLDLERLQHASAVPGTQNQDKGIRETSLKRNQQTKGSFDDNAALTNQLNE